MSDPKKVNPRFAAIAEELAPPPPEKPRRDRVPAVTKIDPPSALPGAFDPARDYASEQLQVSVGREVRREIADGRPAILFEGFVLVLVKRERKGGGTVSSLETYEGWDGRARIQITIEREEALYGDVYNAGGYAGRVKKW